MNLRKNSYKDTKLTLILFMGYWCLSFFEGFISGAVGAISRYYIIIFIIYLLLSAKKLFIGWKAVIISIWAIYYFASLLWSPHPEQGMIYLNSLLSMSLLTIIISGLSFDNRFIRINMRMIAFFSFLLGGLGLFLSNPYLGRISTRQVLTLFGVQLDPNNMVALYAYGVAIGLHSIMDSKLNGIIKSCYLIATLINAYDILMTGSRSGIVVLLVLFLISFFYQSEEERKTSLFFRRVFFIAIIIMATYLAVSYMPRDIFLRITGQDVNLAFTDSTGRSERWKEGLNLLWETRPILGCGWGAFECHGTFFTFLVDTGIIGIVLIGSVVLGILIDCIRRKKGVAILIFAAGMIPSILIGAQNRRFFWNALIVPIMILNAMEECNEFDYITDTCKNKGERIL